MIKKIFAGSLLSLGLSSSTLYAETVPTPNGTWLLGVCSGLITDTTPTPNNNFCAGLIQGVMLSWYTAEQQVNPEGATFWINEFGNIPAFDSAKMVVKYLGQNPQALQQGAVNLIIAAINQNYPIPPAATPHQNE
ncbi:MAG: hypothetical protein NTV32_02750 [Gammaproteobacteria bacterium]|nr:hypothetical protein [Gammaproteobacteria bacterium]